MCNRHAHAAITVQIVDEGTAMEGFYVLCITGHAELQAEIVRTARDGVELELASGWE